MGVANLRDCGRCDDTRTKATPHGVRSGDEAEGLSLDERFGPAGDSELHE